MEHVVFITSNYPSEARPACGTFVRQLVMAVSRHGIKCSVINPVSVFDVIRYRDKSPLSVLEPDGGGGSVRTLRPRYLSMSNKNILIHNTARFTQSAFEWAVTGAMSLLDDPPTIIYGHFLYPGGGAAVRIASRTGVPSMVAVGESTFWSVEPMGYQRAIDDFAEADGFVAVSEAIRDNLIDKLKIQSEKIRVFPNGVDLKRFYKRDRAEMRMKLNLPMDRFIIAFVGHFNHRKGPNRVLEAASGLHDCGLVFIGKGDVPLESDRILFKGTLPHSTIPEMLSAADIFVLPTLAEGDCNAIVEALACGLPVVTSRGDFNRDIAYDGVAIMVDPMDINEIRDAIKTLKEDPELRAQMSARAILKARERDINVRASKIIGWMGDVKARTLYAGSRA